MAPSLREFEELAKNKPSRCVIGRSVDRLDGQDRVNLEAALAAPHIGHNTIASWLKKRELPGRGPAVKAHRQGSCCCA